MKLKTFVENNKKPFIIVAVVLLLVAFVITMVFSFFSGTVQTIGYITGSIICVISAAMFLMIGSLDRKKKENNDKTGTESASAEKPKIKKKVSKFIFIISIIMIFSCILCACGIFMILSNIYAVRISGIVIACIFGFIAFIIALFFHLFVY